MGDDRNIVERLADIEHRRWSGWQRHLHDLCFLVSDGLLIPTERVAHWERLIATDYADLQEHSKESDRKEARKTMAVVGDTITRLTRERDEARAEAGRWKSEASRLYSMVHTAAERLEGTGSEDMAAVMRANANNAIARATRAADAAREDSGG